MIQKLKLRMILVLFLFVSVGLVISGCSQQIDDNPLSDQNQEQMTNQDGDVRDDSDDEKRVQTASINDLLSSGNAVHCTYDAEMDGQTVQQDVYISGDQYRVEVDVAFDGQEMQSTMVYDGEWIYSWNTQSAQGIKFSQEFMDEQGDSSEQISVDTTETYAYDCESWSPSADSFRVPNDIEFMDFSEFAQNMEDMMADIPGMDIPN